MEDGTQKEIQYIQKGDRVITSSSTSASANASDAIITGIKEVRDYYLSDGTIISMTDNHPVYTTKGWVYAEDLTAKHEVIKARKCKSKLKNMDMCGQQKEPGTTNQQKKLMVKEDGYTSGLGNWKMEFSQEDMKYIIKTITRIITTPATWNYSLPKNMLNTIKEKRGYLEVTKIERRTLNNLIVLDILLQNGIVQMKAENGIETNELLWEGLRSLRTNREIVVSVEQNSCIGKLLELCTVVGNVSMKHTKKDIKIQLKRFASSAIMNTPQIGQIEKRHVVKNVLINLYQVANACLQKVINVWSVAKTSMEPKDPNIVVMNVENLPQIKEGLNRTEHLKVEPAMSVEQYLKAVTQKLSTVGRIVEVVTIIGKSEKRKETVYNFAVEGTETYLVNGGVVVHNCDLITMALVTMHVYYPTYEAATIKMVTNDGTHFFAANKKDNYSAYDSY